MMMAMAFPSRSMRPALWLHPPAWQGSGEIHPRSGRSVAAVNDLRKSGRNLLISASTRLSGERGESRQHNRAQSVRGQLRIENAVLLRGNSGSFSRQQEQGGKNVFRSYDHGGGRRRI
jgi:hypothetical protein